MCLPAPSRPPEERFHERVLVIEHSKTLPSAGPHRIFSSCRMRSQRIPDSAGNSWTHAKGAKRQASGVDRKLLRIFTVRRTCVCLGGAFAHFCSQGSLRLSLRASQSCGKPLAARCGRAQISISTKCSSVAIPADNLAHTSEDTTRRLFHGNGISRRCRWVRLENVKVDPMSAGAGKTTNRSSWGGWL